jgi:hypothetical protein
MVLAKTFFIEELAHSREKRPRLIRVAEHRIADGVGLHEDRAKKARGRSPLDRTA